MKSLSTPLVLAALVAPLSATPSQGAPQDASREAPNPAPAAGADEASIFGEPLLVNGRRITDMEIKSFLCYGKGRNALEEDRLGLLMRQERELRAFQTHQRLAAEMFPEKSVDDLTDEERSQVDAKVEEELSYMKVSEEELQARLAEQRAGFQQRYPTLEWETEIRRSFLSVAWFENELRQTMEFDAMFFPGHPDNWPEFSREAIMASSPEFDLIADYASAWEWRKEQAEETGEPMKREDEMMMALLRDAIMAGLASLVELQTQVDGLPSDVLMHVEGGGFEASLMTDDIYSEMEHAFSEQDVIEAKRYLALYHATRDKLEKMGVLIPREDFLEQVREMRLAMERSIFTFEVIALSGHRFPSLETYIEHMYLLESFKRNVIAQDIERNENNAPPPALLAHLPVANVIAGIGRCQAEVLLVSAFDFPAFQWKEDGWERARQRALEVRAEIDTHIDALVAQDEERRKAVQQGINFEPTEELKSFDEFWSDTLDLYSDFWDPPMPLTGHMPPALSLVNKGRFRQEPMTGNDFRRAIGEGSYYHFLWNRSITDEVYYNLEPGTVGGPYRGPYGYYIVYLRSRKPPERPLDVTNDYHFQMLAEDYSRIRFQEFAHEALAEADVRGL